MWKDPIKAFQSFEFPNQSVPCLAISTFLCLVCPGWARSLALPGFSLKSISSTPPCSFGINTWCISVSLWSSLCFDWADCLHQAAGPFICTPPPRPQRSKDCQQWLLKPGVWLGVRGWPCRRQLGCNLQYIINTGEVQRWKSILRSKVSWYMLLWYFNC